MTTLISGPTYHNGQESYLNATVALDNGQLNITDDESNALQFDNDHHIIPGMIDMHIHGSLGVDVMDATPAALQTIADSLLQQGTVGFLATTMTSTPEHIEKALINAAEFARTQTVGAKVLGVHLEGPFIAPEYTGAQRRELIIDPDVELFKHWQAKTDNIIKMVTVAPERNNSDALIQHCVNTGVIVSFGHSAADYQQTNHAIDMGVTHATHLFNAMRGIHHREPGAVTALLLRDEVYAELICDGHHLADAVIDLAYEMKTPERLMLVTDATRAQCMPAGEYELGGQKIFLKDNTVRLADGTLAGSVVTLPEAIKHTLRASGCSLNDIVKMTSINPALQLNIKPYGAVVLDQEYNVINSFY